MEGIAEQQMAEDEAKAEQKGNKQKEVRESSEGISIDVDIDNMVWEVETERPYEEDTAYQDAEGFAYDEVCYDYPGAAAARRCNKHLFVWAFSFICGIYGIDRFVRGQVTMGVLKLLTFGGLGFWYLTDLIIAMVKAYAGEYRDSDDFLFDRYGRYL